MRVRFETRADVLYLSMRRRDVCDETVTLQSEKPVGGECTKTLSSAAMVLSTLAEIHAAQVDHIELC